MDRALFPFWKTGKTQVVSGSSGGGAAQWRGGGTHVGELVGRRSVVQQQVDDVCVALLGSLMEGGVTVLGGGAEQLDSGVLVLKWLKRTSPSYLCPRVDLCLVLQQEIHHFHVAIVTGHVQGGVSQLGG